MSRFLVWIAVLALGAMCFGARADVAYWEIGVPYHIDSIDGLPLEWSDGLGLAFSAVQQHASRVEIVMEVSYRLAAFDGLGTVELGGIPEEDCAYHGDRTQLFTGSVGIRTASEGRSLVYAGVSVGFLVADLGDLRAVCHLEGEPDEWTGRSAWSPEARGTLSAVVGVSFAGRSGMRLALQAEGGIVSDGGGVWVAVGPCLRFGAGEIDWSKRPAPN